MSDSKTFVLCGAAWDCEVGQDAMGKTFYPSEKALKTYYDCWPECGLIEVEVRMVRTLVEPLPGYPTCIPADEREGNETWIAFKTALENATEEIGKPRELVLAMRISRLLSQRRKDGGLSEREVEAIAHVIASYDEYRGRR